MIIDELMAETLFGGASRLGRRIRYVGRSREAPARNVVLDQVVQDESVSARDFPTRVMTLDVERVSRVYRASPAAMCSMVVVCVRVRGDALSAFANTFRELGRTVFQSAGLENLATADDAMTRERA